MREATDATAAAVMSQLTGQGMKMVLPALLKGLEEAQWRKKVGSVQLLGAMAHCAPKQLSACLPTIVPRLSETLTDTHPKVQHSARTALHEVGSVIKNPEISALVPAIMDAIIDPNAKAAACLDTLLETTFVNSVDAPSLALIVPIIARGLRERKADLKKKAAKISGNMCALVASPADLAPYVPALLPELKKALVDPIPEVRAIAARALASLLQGMGESHFPDLVPWLQQTLCSDTSSGERSGAAQGLAECLAVLGPAHVDALVPDIVAGCSASRPPVREGYFTLLRFLPATLGQAFQPSLGAVLGCVLNGLSDDNEGARDAALSAGKCLVDVYARSSLNQLLPAVESGISSLNWRIRQSSIELLGELLFKVSGVTGKIQTSLDSDDEGISTDNSVQALLQALGETRRAEVLATVYLARNDVALAVRNTALHVWKTLVVNTPRTLGEVLPALMERVIRALADEDEDPQTAASRCLGELVRKLGERVLPTIVPILQKGLSAEEAAVRQGVCLGLADVLQSATRMQLAPYYGRLIPTVQQALCDEDADVRAAAGTAFNLLFRGEGAGGGGGRGGGGGGTGADAAAEIVPALLAAIEEDPNALDGLKQVLKAQPRLLGQVLPRLTAPPIKASSARMLAAVAEAAGASLPPHLPQLLPALISGAASKDEETRGASADAAMAVVLALDEEDAHLAIAELLAAVASNTAEVRGAGARLVTALAKQAPELAAESGQTFVSALFPLLADSEAGVVRAGWDALCDVVSAVPKEEYPEYVRCFRDAVSIAREKERRKKKPACVGPRGEALLPGLCLPKGLQPLVPIYLAGLLQGSGPEARELAAEALGEAMEMTNEEALKPHVIAVTGPLIRIISDKFPSSVKAAILGALAVVLQKGGAALKPFLPQLQTTFVKCLQDPAAPVRTRAADCLGSLSALQPRVDPLLGDLLTGAKAAAPATTGVRYAMFRALRRILAAAGQHASPAVVGRAAAEIPPLLAEPCDDDTRAAGAGALAQAARLLPEDGLLPLLQQAAQRCGQSAGGADARMAGAACLEALSGAVPAPAMEKAAPVACAACKAAAGDDKAAVREWSLRALGALLAVSPGPLRQFAPVLAAAAKDEASEV